MGEPRKKKQNISVCVFMCTPNLRNAGMSQIEVTKDSEEMAPKSIKSIDSPRNHGFFLGGVLLWSLGPKFDSHPLNSAGSAEQRASSLSLGLPQSPLSEPLTPGRVSDENFTERTVE